MKNLTNLKNYIDESNIVNIFAATEVMPNSKVEQAKTFCGKAKTWTIPVVNNGEVRNYIFLQSFNTIVAVIRQREYGYTLNIPCTVADLSHTTLRHIKSFLVNNGIFDYPGKGLKKELTRIILTHIDGKRSEYKELATVPQANYIIQHMEKALEIGGRKSHDIIGFKFLNQQGDYQILYKTDYNTFSEFYAERKEFLNSNIKIEDIYKGVEAA